MLAYSGGIWISESFGLSARGQGVATGAWCVENVCLAKQRRALLSFVSSAGKLVRVVPGACFGYSVSCYVWTVPPASRSARS